MIYVPARSAEDWRHLPTDPDRQWKTGYSAKTLAHCWQEAAGGFPPSVGEVFQTSGSATFQHIEALLILPEYKVEFPGGGGASQNDIFILAKSADQLVSITVEGKVDEPFGQPVADWYREPSAGKLKRLEFLCSELNLPVDAVMETPYQLVHRTVSAKLLARRFQAGIALMLVHSFSKKDTGFAQYAKYAALFGIDAAIGAVQSARLFDGLVLYLGWVKGDREYVAV